MRVVVTTMADFAREHFERELKHGGWESLPWEHYAMRENLQLPAVGADAVVFIARGGAELHVLGDVGSGATVLVAGGGATVTVGGSVGAGARILASGGGAEIRVRGAVQRNAKLVASGGGARVEGRQ